MKKLLLPDADYFQSDNKEVPPLVKFYDWIVRASNPVVDILFTEENENGISNCIKHVDVSKIIIHDEYEEKLKKVTKKFLMKKYKCYAKQADKEIPFHFLNIGPSTRDVENKNKHYVYLEDGFLRSMVNEQGKKI